MKDILLPIIKLNRYALNPEKINNTLFKFFLDRDIEIKPEKNNILPTGFYLKHIEFEIKAGLDLIKYHSISNSCIMKESEIFLNTYCYKKTQKDSYFAQRFDVIQKNTCILYLNIVSSSNEENYIFNITNR